MNTGNHFEQQQAAQQRTDPQPEPATGWELLGWAVVAIVATACAVILALVIGHNA